MDSNEEQVVYQNSKFGLEELWLLAHPIYYLHANNSRYSTCVLKFLMQQDLNIHGTISNIINVQ
jgi:hypothetical protein